MVEMGLVKAATHEGGCREIFVAAVFAFHTGKPVADAAGIQVPITIPLKIIGGLGFPCLISGGRRGNSSKVFVFSTRPAAFNETARSSFNRPGRSLLHTPTNMQNST
jgi:hypothetical protein